MVVQTPDLYQRALQEVEAASEAKKGTNKLSEKNAEATKFLKNCDADLENPELTEEDNAADDTEDMELEGSFKALNLADREPEDKSKNMYRSDDEDEEGIDEETEKIITDLRKLDDVYLSLKDMRRKELDEINRKYEDSLKKCLEERTTILQKKSEGDDDFVAYENTLGTPTIPGFWHDVLSRTTLQAYIGEQDMDSLAYISEIKVEEEDPDGGNFGITFYFAENPYFYNKYLKLYVHTERREYEDDVNVVGISLISNKIGESGEDEGEIKYYGDETEVRLDGTNSTVIQWKPTKNLCLNYKKQKKSTQKKKGKGRNKNSSGFESEKYEGRMSFFNRFFRSLGSSFGRGQPCGEDSGLYPSEVDDIDEDEESAEEIVANLLTEHFEILTHLKNVVIPHAVRYYNGEKEDSDIEAEDSDDHAEYDGSDDGGDAGFRSDQD